MTIKGAGTRATGALRRPDNEPGQPTIAVVGQDVPVGRRSALSLDSSLFSEATVAPETTLAVTGVGVRAATEVVMRRPPTRWPDRRHGVPANRRAESQRSNAGPRRADCSSTGRRIIACVDVRALAEDKDPDHQITPDILLDVAMRRVQGSIRPGDLVCVLGGTRLVVCLGNGVPGAQPGLLGTRLAQNVGHHLTCGTASVQLQVLIGVATAPATVSWATVVAAAVGAANAVRARVAQADNPVPVHVVSIDFVPEHQLAVKASGWNAGTSGAKPHNGAGPAARLTRRVLMPITDDLCSHADARPNAPESQAPVSADRPLRILVADTMPAASRKPGVAASAVAALLSPMGVETKRSIPSGPEELLSDVKAAAPHLVMLVLHAGGTQQHHVADAGDAWEFPAILTRACQQAGVPVIAVSIGGSAAALAGCVAHGALGVLDIEQLPAELAQIAGCRASRRGDTAAPHDGSRQSEPPHRKLPPTFERLTHLTPTERRVLYHLTEGLSAGEIAERMIVSLSTVRTHIRSILRKLNVCSQIGAVAIANGAGPAGHRDGESR